MANSPEPTALRIEYWPLSDLIAWPTNPKSHDVGAIHSSIKRFGFTDPIIVDERTGKLAAGHGRSKTLNAIKLGGEPPPKNIVVRDDGEWLAPVVRGVTFADDVEHEAYLVGSNRSGELGGWEEDRLRHVLEAVNKSPDGLFGTGYDVEDMQDIIANLDGARQVEQAPPAPIAPWVKVGDLFALGEHRLLCGNASIPSEFAKLTAGDAVDCILTDPPYCSGGFQEADRIQGSIGTTQKDYTGQTVSIANDILSTRGYKALIQGVLDVWNGKLAYVFTDWRMWTNLTDTMETQGYGIRSMIVWDKGTPGMGVGWRSQHELIACGSRVKAPFRNVEASGNVIKCERSGNEHHPTEKPVALLSRILETTGMARKVGDPFVGSGSTIIACEERGRVCYATELSPYFVQVCIERWEAFTGKKAEKLAEGEGRTAINVHGSRRIRPHEQRKKTRK